VTDSRSDITRIFVLVAVTVVVVVAIFFIQARRSGLTVREMFSGPPPSVTEAIEANRASARVGAYRLPHPNLSEPPSGRRPL
jgi:hypothetical protein